MKVTLRLTLLSVLVGLLFLTVTILGYSSYANARFTADDLSQQILDQTSLGIDGQINGLLNAANTQGDLNRRLLEAGQQNAQSFPRLATYWVEVLKSQPRLTRISLGLEASGEWLYVRRRPDGRLAIGELRKVPGAEQLALRNYWPEQYPDGKPFHFDPDKTNEDPRLRTWYRAGKRAGKQTWSETYVFFGTEGVADVPGVSCATPFFRDGKLLGVLTTSFDLGELCSFLKDLRVGTNGYAFVVEDKRGERLVVAHPRREILMRDVRHQGEEPIRELVPVADLADPLVPAFLAHLPSGLAPGQLKDKGMQSLHFLHDDVHYLGAYRCLSTGTTPDWLICIVLPEADILGRVEQSNRRTFFLGLGALALALLISLYVSARVARPLGQLARETEAIGQLRVEARPVAHSPVLEVDRLAVAMEDMKTSLRSFQKFVPADLVRRLLSAGQEARLGGENKTVTIYFCDLAGFTAVSEKLAPADLVQLLGEYFESFSSQILASGGTVDKYIGDAIMAFWGAPVETSGHALAACTAALRDQQALTALRRKWQAEGRPPLFARIGIHTGEVVVGNIGSPARLNYTVMGDAVNLASRLEGLNKYYETEILISEQTYRGATQAVLARPLDWVSVKGKTEAVLIYELLGLKTEVDKTLAAVAELSGAALERYRHQDWTGASEVFEQILRLRPQDGPARVMLARCHIYVEHPPGETWDGVHRMESK